MISFALPCIYGGVIYPPTRFAQSLVVLHPVSIFLLALHMQPPTVLTITKNQIAELEKGSTDLGNNTPVASTTK